MNDFTKDELQYLLELADSILIVNRSVNEDELQEKLQFMVDNYERTKEWEHKMGICDKCGRYKR